MDCVISKLGVIYILNPVGYTKPKELIILLAEFKLEAENKSLDDIEHWRQGASLEETMRSFEKISCTPIYQRGYPQCFDTGLDPLNKPRVKSISEHDLKEKVIVYSFKGICNI